VDIIRGHAIFAADSFHTHAASEPTEEAYDRHAGALDHRFAVLDGRINHDTLVHDVLPHTKYTGLEYKSQCAALADSDIRYETAISYLISLLVDVGVGAGGAFAAAGGAGGGRHLAGITV